ncbi:MAG: fibronectin type III domain-containing protein [Desulfuromonadaceae bacterium]|nr:fibronectin type III domain-containing protein [Desulfuromonadaceae bacterium]
MAQLYEDFSGHTLNAAPSGWTKRINTNLLAEVRESVGATGGKVLLIEEANYPEVQILTADLFDADADAADVKTLVKFRCTNNLGAAILGPVSRVSGSSHSTSSYYAAQCNGFGNEDRIYKRISGSPSTLIANATTELELGQWVWVRYENIGTNVRAKFWADGVSEPAAWTVEGTDADISVAGWVGFATGSTAITPKPITEIDIISIATGTDELLTGATAPDTSPTIDSITTTSTEATVTYSGLDAEANGVEYEIDSSGTWTTAGTENPFVVSGLTASTTYTIAVRAYNAAGSGPEVTDSFTTSTAVDPVKGIDVVLNSGANPLADLTGITAVWWDASAPNNSPIVSVTDLTTDATGLLTLNIDASTALIVGDIGFLLLYQENTTTPQDSLVFASQMTIEDIS